MKYDLNKISKESLNRLFAVLQDVRSEYELKGINPFLYVLEDFENDEKRHHLRVLRNLNKENILKINKLWPITILFLNYVKITIDDSFFDFYNEVENKVNVIDDKNIESQIVPKGYEKWKDIALSFVGDQQVKIIHKGENKIITFEEFGFADTRGKQAQDIKAKKSWDLLKLFATQEGVCPLDRMSVAEKNTIKKQKQELVKILKIYFGIKDAPISYNKNENAYIINFKMMPLEEFKDDYLDKDIIDEM